MSKAREERVRALIGAESTLVLATTGADSVAEAAPLFYLADEDLSLYWFSSPASRHSRNLAARPAAAITIFRNTADWRRICGVQMRGWGRAVEDSVLGAALRRRYAARHKLGRTLHLLLVQSMPYSFRPESIRYIDNTRRLGGGFEMVRGPEGWNQA